MNEALTRLWGERSGRERFAIAFASILMVVALAYAYGWLPVVRERDRLLESVPRLRAEARQVERMAAELNNLQRAPTKVDADLKAAIEQTTGAMSAVRVVAQRGQGLRVTIDSVDAAPVLSWIAQIQSAYGVRPERLSMTPLDGNRVRIEVDLAVTK
jgi:type II secretory pathway component PulM